MTTIADTAPVVATTSNRNTSETSATTLSSDFDTYLKMLTVQMENQDPLDPADASEFSVQLATFSSLEQQVLGNQLLEQLLDAAGGGNGMGMIDVLGRQALVASGATFTGQPIEVRMPELPDHASAVMRIQNDFGGTLASVEVPEGTHSLSWPPEGSIAETPHATYRFVIETTDSEGVVQSTQALVPMQVTEVMRRGTDFDLVLADGSVHASADVAGFAE